GGFLVRLAKGPCLRFGPGVLGTGSHQLLSQLAVAGLGKNLVFRQLARGGGGKQGAVRDLFENSNFLLEGADFLKGSSGFLCSHFLDALQGVEHFIHGVLLAQDGSGILLERCSYGAKGGGGVLSDAV